MKRFILKYSLLCAIGWTVVIFVLCCTPGKYVPTAHWLDLLSFDKLVHASIFFVLSSLWFLYFIKTASITSFRIAAILVSCVAYGGMLEIMQATIFSQRSGDWLDFIANSVGCLSAFILFKRKKLFLLPNT
ncbi:MAG: VanZ family protein [Bacteroidota bacterium]